MKLYKLNDDLSEVNTKKILIYTGGQNLIQLARKNKMAYEQYKKLLAKDYILYFYKNGVSRLQQRTQVNELWVKKDLYKCNDVYYTLDKPINRKNSTESKTRLLVIFPCMPEENQYDSYLIRARMFPTFFNGIERSLVKNVHIMRIMDLNCSHGSHFVNTNNYPNMEDDIQAAIRNVIQKLNISKEQVICYGASKGGTGAILHGALGDYKSLAVDPILNLEYYNRSDYHFLKNLREVDITDRLNNYLADSSSRTKYIICSPNVKFNYENTQKINKHSNLNVIELNDNHIKKHADVSRNSVPIQLMIINSMFTDFSQPISNFVE